MEQWRTDALGALDDARQEVLAASEPTIVVVLSVAEADMLRERPVSVYANQTKDWLHRFLCFVSWRTSLPEALPKLAK